MARGLAILKDESAVQRVGHPKTFEFRVKSQSTGGYYTVSKQSGIWGCTCPDFKNRKNNCKHIYAVHYQMKMQRMVKEETKPIEPVDNTFKPFCCPSCGSEHVKKNGTRNTRRGQIQRFKCVSCNNRFTVDKGFNGMKNKGQVILASVDLYFKGLSFRKISDHLSQFYGVKVSQTTPMRWVEKYMKLLGEYAEKNQPDVGMMWHSDEMTANIDGKKHWIWNVMDSETRFLLACKISQSRDTKDARKPLKAAKELAGKAPDFVITDGLQSYPIAIKKEYGPFGTTYERDNLHHRYVDFQHAPNNNILERLNGTVRERTKVMRGFDTVPTAEALLAGFQTYYNYIREHSVIETTPAMASNIDLGLGDNRWQGMVELIANQKQFGESARN